MEVMAWGRKLPRWIYIIYYIAESKYNLHGFRYKDLLFNKSNKKTRETQENKVK